jgi:hypothetical protein
VAGVLGIAGGCATGPATPKCASISDCPLGSYCNAMQVCATDCTSDTQCVTALGRGAFCTSFGQCAGGSDAGLDAGGSDAGLDGGGDASSDDAGEADAGDAAGADTGSPDAGGPDAGSPDAAAADAGSPDAGSPDAGRDGGGALPYRHTIVVDGSNDFTAPNEQFATTTFGFPAFVAWDDAAVYVGYDNTDVASASPTKFVLLYLDVDGAASGTTTGVLYRTQQPTLPFHADYHLRWKTDGTFTQLMRWNESAGAWQPTADAIPAARSGSLVELAVPRAAIGAPAAVGLLGLMINEAEFAESTFAGLPTRAGAPSFVDGYRAQPTQWLAIDWASATVPNDPSRLRP